MKTSEKLILISPLFWYLSDLDPLIETIPAQIHLIIVVLYTIRLLYYENRKRKNT